MQPRPAHALRLFPGHEDGGGAPEIASWEIGRLCEDGDSRDLAWLTAAVPEERLADWLRQHGGRQLSRRSRAFWEVLLGRPAGPSSEIGHEIWLL
jgi:hypothetical protein